MTANGKYTGTAQLLHWLIAVFVVTQFALAWSADALPRSDLRTALMLVHKSVGMTVLMLAIIRIVWRVTHTPPAFPASMARAEQWLSRSAHWLLYALIFLMPLSGWLMTSAAGRTVNWFWLFDIPAPMGENERWGDIFHETHEILAWALFGVALFHVLAALWHATIRKDGVLQRMLP